MLFAAIESLGSYYQQSGRLAAGVIAEGLNSSLLGMYKLDSELTYSVLLSIPTPLTGPSDNSKLRHSSIEVHKSKEV